jgi:hypothetical protein
MYDLRIIMPEDQRAVSATIVYVFIVFDINDSTAKSAFSHRHIIEVFGISIDPSGDARF